MNLPKLPWWAWVLVALALYTFVWPRVRTMLPGQAGE